VNRKSTDNRKIIGAFLFFTHYMQLTTPVLVLLFLLGERHEYRSGSSAE